ncbi:MAG TPA: glycosyltransferase family 2 protein [Patescibacteria group bacterium]|nr:glycosyltransferase family 2 protein [Patescibacteria group bacterium]
MKKPLVSVIIVNWNGKQFLKECLDSLMGGTYKDIEILLVDNASTDSSVVMVKRHYPSVTIIQNETNAGVAEGYDIGYKYSKGSAILLLNSDTILEDDVISGLVNVLYSNNRYGAVQPKMILQSEKDRIDSVGSFFLPTGNLYHFGREKNPNDPKYNVQREIFSTKGACMLIRREVLERTGLFDKNFFAYYEDTDLCIRIWMSGYKIIYTPSVKMYHKGGGGGKQIMRSYILFHAHKNRIYTYLKNFSGKYILKTLPVTLLLYQVLFVGYLLTGKFSYAGAVQRGILWNILHVRQTLKKRKHIQSHIRKIPDEAYLPRVTKQVRLSYYYYQMFGGMDRYRD